MLGKVKTIFNRLNGNSADAVTEARPNGQTSVSENGGTADETATDGFDAASPPHLYKCPSCDRVYVATDKRTCSTCDTAVDLVEQSE